MMDGGLGSRWSRRGLAGSRRPGANEADDLWAIISWLAGWPAGRPDSIPAESGGRISRASRIPLLISTGRSNWPTRLGHLLLLMRQLAGANKCFSSDNCAPSALLAECLPVCGVRYSARTRGNRCLGWPAGRAAAGQFVIEPASTCCLPSERLSRGSPLGGQQVAAASSGFVPAAL